MAGVALPARLGVAGAPGTIVTKSGLVMVGGGDTALSVYDAKTGKELLRKELGRRATATPMTLGQGLQPNYNELETPSVWRNNRTQAAAKVDALSSGGMDDLEIPAFLRKQAD